MGREIKFDLIYKGEHGFHHKKYHLCELMRGISKVCDIHSFMELAATRQYVGLKDKNGLELYEGDIINVSGHLSAIQHERYLDFYFWYERTQEFCSLAFLTGYKNFEIVGNVYENPELMESDDE